LRKSPLTWDTNRKRHSIVHSNVSLGSLQGDTALITGVCPRGTFPSFLDDPQSSLESLQTNHSRLDVRAKTGNVGALPFPR
jgi:hypothetical protein